MHTMTSKRPAPPRRKRYYQHPRGYLAHTADECEGAVYQAFGYLPITAKQHAAEKRKGECEDDLYESEVARLTRRINRGK